MAEKREIEISLKSNKAEASADKLNRKVKGIGVSADSAESSLSKLTKVAAAVGAALATAQIKQYADAWTNVNNRLSASTTTHSEFMRAQQGVISIANEAGVSISGIADSYARLAQSTSELGISQERVLTVTRNVALALKAGGATAQEVSSIAVQLGQGLGSGALQGDELRSVLESSIPIAKALAKEFNTTTGELKKLGANGELTAKRVVRALENIDKKSLEFAKDIAGGFAEVSNALTVYVGGIDQSIGATKKINGVLSSLSENIDSVVNGALLIVTIFGVKYVGALTSATVASISKFSANEKLLASELLLLKSAQSRAQSEALAAIQQQEAAKRYLAMSTATGMQSKAIAGLAVANGKAISTQAALTATTNAYTAAASRATVISRGLGAALAFVGGPVGVAIIAAAALYTFSDGADNAKESARKAADEVNILAKSFGSLSRNRRATLLNETEAEMAALSKQLVQANSQLNSIKGFSDSPIKAQGIRQLEGHIKSLNDEMDSLSNKQAALIGSPDLSDGTDRGDINKTPKSDSIGATDTKAFDSLKARLQLETEAIQAEAEVRRAFAEGQINQRQLDEELALQSVYYNYEARRVAILENERLTHDQRVVLLAELAQQEIDAEQIKQDQITGKTQEGADNRTDIAQQESSAIKGMLINTAVAAFNLTQNANQKMTKEQKKQAKKSIYIQTAAAIARAYGENNFYVASGMALFLAGMQLKQINAAESAGSSSVTSSAPSAIVQQAPSVSNQSQRKIINITGLEGFGPDDMIPVTRAQFESYLSESEGANIAINQGQSNAARIGAI